MSTHPIEDIKSQMLDARAAVRVRAIGRIADKKGGSIELNVDRIPSRASRQARVDSVIWRDDEESGTDRRRLLGCHL